MKLIDLISERIKIISFAFNKIFIKLKIDQISKLNLDVQKRAIRMY